MIKLINSLVPGGYCYRSQAERNSFVYHSHVEKDVR